MMMMMIPRTARMMHLENVTVVLVPTPIRLHLRAHRRHLRRLAEAIGRGPGNRRGVPS